VIYSVPGILQKRQCMYIGLRKEFMRRKKLVTYIKVQRHVHVYFCVTRPY